jgi:pimeloyl-ACP methyl ester carboxylesterase
MITKKIFFLKSFLNYSIHNENGSIILLFIHGYMESSYIWNEIIENLPPNIRAICIDLPGHGMSVECKVEYHISDLSDCISDILTNENIAKISIAAHSMGGYVALEFAKKYPLKILSLIMFNSHPFADTLHKKRYREKEIKYIAEGKKELLVKTFLGNCLFDKSDQNKIYMIINEAIKCTDIGLINAQKAMIERNDNSNVFVKIDNLTFISGQYDEIVNIEIIKKLKFSTKANKIEISNTKHFTIIEKPKECVAIILKSIT